MRKMRWKEMWRHIAKSFDNSDSDYYNYYTNSYGHPAICGTLTNMLSQGIITESMSNKASKLILKALKGKAFLYEVGTKRGCKLRAAFCRRQAVTYV